MCWPTFSTSGDSDLIMQVEERRPRYPGEPRNRRLRLVNERGRRSDEWNLVGSSRGSRRSQFGSEHGHGHQEHPVQGHPHQHHQWQTGHPPHAQIQHHPHPHQHPHQHHLHHEQSPVIQVIDGHGFVPEDDGNHGQYRLIERVPVPQHLQARHRGGGRAQSPAHGHHRHHARYSDSSSSSDEESHRGGRRRGGRVLSIEDDDSFEDYQPPVRQWRRRSSSHRSTSRRRR